MKDTVEQGVFWNDFIKAWEIIERDFRAICSDEFMQALLNTKYKEYDEPAQPDKIKKKPYYRKGRWE